LANTIIRIRAGKQYLRWLDLFGKDTTVYSVVLREGNDISHTYYTGNHVDCLMVMRDIFRKNPHAFSAGYSPDLLNTETGRLMSWSMEYPVY
jgi:hypothetical protein